MRAFWKIETSGEVLSVMVTRNHQAFENLINSHPNMRFCKWG